MAGYRIDFHALILSMVASSFQCFVWRFTYARVALLSVTRL